MLTFFGIAWEPLPTDDAHDYLDAEVSYLCVAAALRGRAILLGDHRRGGFTVPATERAQKVQEGYKRYELDLVKKWHKRTKRTQPCES